MKDDSFDCTLIAHLRIFLLFCRLLYCLILPENRLFFGIWKVVEIEEEWHPLFVEALQNESKISYLVDMLMFGTDEEILDFSRTEGRR